MFLCVPYYFICLFVHLFVQDMAYVINTLLWMVEGPSLPSAGSDSLKMALKHVLAVH